MNSKTRKEKKASGFLSSKFFWLLLYIYICMWTLLWTSVKYSLTISAFLKKQKTKKTSRLVHLLFI